MAGGLAGLLDDVAAIAKLAAASIDDVGAAAGRASAKAAGVVVDDTAVTPAYVRGLAADRELPIIKRIAIGSLRNKLLIILPVALVLSAVAPTLVEIILMAGGTYLCFEGAEKIYHRIKNDDHDHDIPVAMQGPDAEEKTIKGAIRTDLILSAEIMVIALKEVIDESSQKVLVFVPFKHTIDILTDKLRNDGVATEVIRGDVPVAKRTDIFKRFQNTPDPRVLVIQPQSAAHGVTLTAANTVVWWGPTSSLETYAQANARVHRSGQKHRCTVVQLQGSAVEKRVYSLLDNRIDVHTKMIDLYKEILD